MQTVIQDANEMHTFRQRSTGSFTTGRFSLKRSSKVILCKEVTAHRKAWSINDRCEKKLEIPGKYTVVV